MNLSFMWAFSEADYKIKLNEFIGRLHEKNFVLNELSLSLWCGCDNLRDKWLASNYEYRAKDIGFEIRFGRHVG